MEIKPDIHPSANIKVVGIGGGGGNAVNRMVGSKITGVEFVAINTDAQALHYNRAELKVHIGNKTTRGLGAGASMDQGRKAAEEDIEAIRDSLKGADMVFLTCGLGGGTGTGAAPIVADIARELGALCVAVVTKPFAFEGYRRSQTAQEGFQELRSKVDTIIVIPNDKLLGVIDRKTSVLDAFEVVDDVLRQGVQGIADLITVHGMINVDFADVRTIMRSAGSALMGIGYGTGEQRAIEAARAAVESPLLDMSINGAKGVLVNITGGSDLTMHEVSEAISIITEAAHAEANIIFGAVVDESSVGEAKVTVIATGFEPSYQVAPEVKPVSGMGQKTFFDRKTYPVPTPESLNALPKLSPVSSMSKVTNFFGRKNASAPSATFQVRTQPIGLKPTSPERKKIEMSVPVPESEESELDVPAFIRKKMR